MGSWGVGLYQNDVGLDVQGTYRDCRKMGFRGGELAAIVLESAAIGERTISGRSRNTARTAEGRGRVEGSRRAIVSAARKGFFTRSRGGAEIPDAPYNSPPRLRGSA